MVSYSGVAVALAMVGVLGMSVSMARASPYQGLGAESIDPAFVVKHAPPPVPPELANKIHRLLGKRTPGLGIPTEDGKRLVFSWNVTGVSQVWRVDGPRQFPLQLTGGEDHTTPVGLTPDGKIVLVSRDHNGEENPGLYYLSIEGGELTVIQHLPKVQTFYEFTSHDGRYIYFRANDRVSDSYAIYRFDRQTKAKELVFDQPGIWSVQDFLPSGTLLLGKETGSLTSEVFSFDPVIMKLAPLFGQGEKTEWKVRYGAHPGEYLVLTNKFGDFQRLYRYANKTFAPLTPDIAWDISDYRINEGRTKILYTVNEGGYTRFAALDARTFKPLAGPQSPPEADHVFNGNISRSGRFMMFGVNLPRALDKNYLYDWEKRTLTEWTIGSAPELDVSSFVPAKLEHFPMRDGSKIPVFVRRSPQCEKALCPVIVDFHGGPEGQAYPGLNPYAQMFVDAGFIFVQPNVRGSEGYGKKSMALDDGPKRLSVITDIADVSHYIRKNWKVNGVAPKIGITGGSYGGYVTFMAATYFADENVCDAAAAYVGIVDLVSFLHHTAPYRRPLRISEYGDPVKDLDVLKKLSPFTHVGKLKIPLFIAHGLNDPRVPIGEAKMMFEAAQAKGVPTELIIFPNGGHGGMNQADTAVNWAHTLRWFEKHLQGKK